MIGTKLAHYEITSHLGTGGMGEVYQATDSKLGRSVAIKLLPEAFSRDTDRLSRFEREARVLAAVNHPHIAAIYGLEESGGRKFLVMELAAGETLEARISRGPMPLDEALKIAVQIAEALEAAHEKGVMHRDLKPANIKITTDGHVKVLDFGLAKAFEGEAGSVNLSNSPTITMEATNAGVVLGTAAYMSPEQAKGGPVDKRTDIFAFGVVLYEMLTGIRLHQGETISEVMASVLKDTPDLNRVPARIRPLLRSCLQKEPKQRLHDIADAKLLLEVGGGEAEAKQKEKAPAAWIWPSIAVILLLIAVGLGLKLFNSTSPVDQETRSVISPAEGLTFNAGTQAAISPDGVWLAFPAIGPDGISRMYLRNRASLEVKPLPGSEGIISFAPPPFWSYNSRFVVYGALGRLMKSEVTGSPAQPIAETGQRLVQGGTWNREGMILYANETGNLMQVSETGGTPVAVTALAPGETAHRWPQFLPDGRRFLYLRSFRNSEKRGIYVGSLDNKPDEQSNLLLLPTNRQAYWVTSETDGKSFLLFQQEKTLLAQPFDPGTPKLSGTAVPIANGVGAWDPATGGLWSVSRAGMLLYRSGGSLLQIIWRDPKTGRPTGDLGEAKDYANLAVSSDGTKVAFRLAGQDGNYDINVRNIAAGSTNKRLTFDPDVDSYPVFCQDRIVFTSYRVNKGDLYETRADSSGGEMPLYVSEQNKIPTSCSPDGRFLLFSSFDPKTGSDLWVLPLGIKNAAPCVFLNTKDAEDDGQFSPNGRLVAYSVNSSEIYVRPFSPDSPCPSYPGAGSKSEISEPETHGGAYPRFARDGKLYYISGIGDFMAVDLQAGSSSQFKSPRSLFHGVTQGRPWGMPIANDRLWFLEPSADAGPPPPFTLVQNWLAGLKK